jgi:hypothetical protein
MDREAKWAQRTEVLILALGLIFIFIHICVTGNRPLFWDEEWYFRIVHLFEEYGVSLEFLQQTPAGFLYPAIQYFLKFLTGYDPFGVRMVNWVLLLLVIILVEDVLRRQRLNPRFAFRILMFPMVYVFAGLALTEMTSILFLACSLSFLSRMLSTDLQRRKVLSFLGGVCLGLASSGRQLFIIIWPLSLLKISRREIFGIDVRNFIVYTLGVCIVLLPIVIIWGGLMPPKSPIIGVAKFTPNHLILSFAYSFILIWLAASDWLDGLMRPGAKWLTIVLGIVAMLNFYFQWISYLPLVHLIQKVTRSPAIIDFIALSFGSTAILLAGLFFYCIIFKALESRRESYRLYIILALLAMLTTPSIISNQFSSRYVGQALPLFMIALAPSMRYSYSQCVKTGIGVILGIGTLTSYF